MLAKTIIGLFAVFVLVFGSYAIFDYLGEEGSYPEFPGAQGDSWCNTSFAKRIDINMNNTAGSALTDYQVFINLTSNPINETSLRVYNKTDCTLRPHWCENITSGNCYALWINYSAIAASSWVNDTAIYYDNATASSISDGDTTFILFDDFKGTGSDFLNFSRDPHGPILEAGASGAWDDYELREKVTIIQEGGLIHLWYCARGALSLARRARKPSRHPRAPVLDLYPARLPGCLDSAGQPPR